MSTPNSSRIALLIDGANLRATAKTLGFDIDYKRLLMEFSNRGTVLRALYYTAIIEDTEYSNLNRLCRTLPGQDSRSRPSQ
jgi:uncharacterized LabA/DUF88 family protein